MQLICHCKTCPKNSGSAFSMNVVVPEVSLIVEGDALRCYEDQSGTSGQTFHRYFCGACGSHVYSQGPAYGAIAFIKAGTLDDATSVASSTNIWCVGKLLWVAIPEGATQSLGNPGEPIRAASAFFP